MSTKAKFITFATSAALAATLGLAACGGTPAKEEAPASTDSTATTDDTSNAKRGAASTGIVDFAADDEAWCGMTDYSMVYFVEDEASSQAAFMVYYTDDNTFIRYVGSEERDGNNVTITDNTTAESFSFEVEGPDDNGLLTITWEGEDPATLSVIEFESIQNTFDQVNAYATER